MLRFELESVRQGLIQHLRAHQVSLEHLVHDEFEKLDVDKMVKDAVETAVKSIVTEAVQSAIKRAAENACREYYGSDEVRRWLNDFLSKQIKDSMADAGNGRVTK